MQHKMQEISENTNKSIKIFKNSIKYNEEIISLVLHETPLNLGGLI